MQYVKPESTNSYGWDQSHYERGNVHYRGFYNPIEVRPDDTDQETVELLPSENYKAALVANDIIPKALNPEPFRMIKLMVMAAVGASAVTMFGMIYIAGNLPA